MTKEELISITLKQLWESLKTTPENFRFEDPSSGRSTGTFPGPTIIWQFKVKVEENKFIQDPLNSTKTIIVTYSKISKQLSCHIYNREVNSVNGAMIADTYALVQFNDFIPLWIFPTYRKFRKLTNELVRRNEEKEYLDYMKKLGQIFPATHEEDLFK